MWTTKWPKRQKLDQVWLFAILLSFWSFGQLLFKSLVELGASPKQCSYISFIKSFCRFGHLVNWLGVYFFGTTKSTEVWFSFCGSMFYSSVVLVIWSIDLAYTFSGQRVNIILGEKAKLNSWEKANEMKWRNDQNRQKFDLAFVVQSFILLSFWSFGILTWRILFRDSEWI